MLKVIFLDQLRMGPRRTGLLLVMFVGLLSMACTANPGNQNGTQKMKRTDIVAGYGEVTFSQRYNVKLDLPIAEDSFIALLRRLGLHYQLCGRRGSGAGIPPARQQTTVDLSKAETCYEVDGDRDPVRHVGQAWRAFADRNHQIFYIENVFAYTGP